MICVRITVRIRQQRRIHDDPCTDVNRIDTRRVSNRCVRTSEKNETEQNTKWTTRRRKNTKSILTFVRVPRFVYQHFVLTESGVYSDVDDHEKRAWVDEISLSGTRRNTTWSVIPHDRSTRCARGSITRKSRSIYTTITMWSLWSLTISTGTAHLTQNAHGTHHAGGGSHFTHRVRPDHAKTIRVFIFLRVDIVWKTWKYIFYLFYKIYFTRVRLRRKRSRRAW